MTSLYYNTRDNCAAEPPGSDEDGSAAINSHERLSVGELLEHYDDLDEGWRSYLVKAEMQQVYYEWLAAASHWKSFITLTFKDEKPPDVAMAFYRRLVQVLNKRVFGNRYVRKVGHSYFNYVLGMEFKLSRDVCHFHILVDKPIDYAFIHAWWGMAAGMAWISKVNDRERALFYVTKYVCKGGDSNINVYLQAKEKVPDPLPLYWE